MRGGPAGFNTTVIEALNAFKNSVFFQSLGLTAYLILPGPEKDSYVAILQASNVTANTTVMAIVDNGVGQTNRDSIHYVVFQLAYSFGLHLIEETCW